MPPASHARRCCASLTLALLVCAAAVAAPFDTVNDVRRSGCDRGAPPLERQRALDVAAGRLARGASLQQALQQAGYRAEEAVSIHVRGGADDASLRRILAQRFCRDLQNAGVRHGGLWRDAGELWLVLAAPFEPPAPGQATSVAARVLVLVNGARAEARRCGRQRYAAAPPVRLSSALGAAALAHSREMAQSDRFAHEGADGSTPAQRVQRTGYRAAVVAENIAAGPTSPDEVVQGWLNSPGHCANLMDARFAEMGLAYAVATRSRSGIYWTQVFAVPSGAPRPSRSGNAAVSGTNSSETELMQ